MHDAGVGGEPGELDAGRGNREIEHGVDLGEQLERVIGDDDAELAEAGQQSGVLAQRERAFLLDGAADHAAVHGMDGPDQLPAHAPGRTRDGNLHLVHAPDLRRARGIAMPGRVAQARLGKPADLHRQVKATFSSFAPPILVKVLATGRPPRRQ